VVKELGSGSGTISAATVGDAERVEVKAELKKMNKQLKQIIELKKQDNMMAVLFLFLCNLSPFCLSSDH
jgi:16S rRNA C1402 N4-methylase RsmH